jgi:hypothetical protein
MSYGNKSVDNSQAVIIVPANERRQELFLANASVSPDCYIGFDSSVTPSNGYPLWASSTNERSRGMGSTYLGDIWGITASGTADIRWLETTR